jgi:hypothetical protein
MGNAYFNSLKVGDTDPELGVTVKEILFRTSNFIVYLDDTFGIQWATKDDADCGVWMLARVADLDARTAFFRQFSWHSEMHLVSAKRMIAQGVVVGLAGGATAKAEAEAAFASAEKFITIRGREASLIWLYCAFLILALISTLSLLCITHCHNTAEKFWAAMACACAGGLGAFISRALAPRDSLPCDANAGKHLHWLEALMRWGVGLGAGGLTWLVVRGGILLGFIQGNQPNFAAVLAFAMLAGASERFIPTLLSRFDDIVTKEPEEKKPNGGEETDTDSEDDAGDAENETETEDDAQETETEPDAGGEKKTEPEGR